MSEDGYMSDPEAKTLKGFMEVLKICLKHADDPDACIEMAAEHDLIYLPLSTKSVPEDSEEGKRLNALGCHIEDDYDCWGYFT